jgi:heptosyltransferase-2/heptosyltransferase-3
LWSHARTLRARGYDAAVVLRFDHWWGAWLAAAAGIPRRIGYDQAETRPFLTQALPYTPDRHEVMQNAALLETLTGGLLARPGPTRYRVSTEDRAWAAAWLEGAGGARGERLVAIHPGAGAAVKQWPIAGWAAVAHALAEQHGARIVLTGSREEGDLTAAIAARLAKPALDAAGRTTLGQLAALYERCALVLGADCGPLHLAVAAGARTIHLYGPASTIKFGPWGDPADHVVLTTPWGCAPCHRLDWPAEVLAHHACMAAIQPEAVLLAAAGVLAREARTR